jgi:peptidyl-prolyl cis-trans isomerase C
MKSIAIFLFALSWTASAQTPPDTVVARIDGKPVTAAELTAILRANPGEAQKNLLKDPKEFVERLALMRKLTAMAEKAKLDQQSPVKETLELFRSQTLAQAQIDATLNGTLVTADEQKKFYAANPDRYTQAKLKVLFVSFSAKPAPQTDPKAKKILTEAEAKAKVDKLLAELRAGADFVKLVKEHSDDKESAAKDGDFDPIRKSDGVPDNIKSAIFSLKAGQVSEPVRVANGFYLFRLEDLSAATFEQVRDEIFMEIRQTRFNEWLEKTRQSLDVKIENPDFFSKIQTPK